MKFSIKAVLAVLSLGSLALSCSEPDAPIPAPASFASTYTADFSFINAVADGPSSGLDLYVNNIKVGSTSTFLTGVGHTTIPMVLFVSSSGATGANTNIRVKASTGTIGGVLGSGDLIYRAGNNNSNDPALAVTTPATATAAATVQRYTLIALDSTTRPAPLREINANKFGDTTYFNPLTSKYISVVERATLTTAVKSRLAAIGTVPLGSSDVGGPRFLLLTDSYPAAVTSSATQSGFRVINASPNAPPLYARLKYVSGPAAGNILLPAGAAASASYIMAWAAFTPAPTPSVGSRSTTLAFGAGQTTVSAGVSSVYDIEVATDNAFANVIATATTAGVSFSAGKLYSVVISGIYGKTLKVNAVQHN